MLKVVVGVLVLAEVRAEERRRFRIAFANLNDDPSVRVEGLGFTGAEVRRSFELASRTLPVEMVYYDNGSNAEAALANADDAVRRNVDLLIEYNSDLDANAEIGRKLRAAGIAGDLGDTATYLSQRVQGITEGLRKHLSDVALTQLDTSGNAVKLEVPLGKFLASQTRRKVLVATLDDPTALAAKGAIERASRMGDCVIVGQGVDKSIHGGANDKKEIDPNNRGSIILGSVAYYVDRYGYEVLPLAMTMLQGGEVPKRTVTRHILISAKNVFTEYPPYDMN